MVKHILTTKCPRKCTYCISKNINIEERKPSFANSRALLGIYNSLSAKHDSIMLTGGEPSCSDNFQIAVKHAKSMFKKVFLTTQDVFFLLSDYSNQFDAVIFSWHDYNSDLFYKIKNRATIYCSILANLYKSSLPLTLKELGYAGLTINENHFGSETFDESRLPQTENFSIKINRRGKCFEQDTVYIMPDLSIRTSFKEFL
jgi:hypothetical protein